jgi:hypothetical protein
MKKKCPFSNEYFEPKRTNQKFACALNRIKYHNEIARKKRRITRSIDYTLSNNWNILLKQLAESNKAVRSREFMRGAGFNFNFFQRAYKDDNEVIYRIYNCGFYVNQDSVTILKIEI